MISQIQDAVLLFVFALVGGLVGGLAVFLMTSRRPASQESAAPARPARIPAAERRAPARLALALATPATTTRGPIGDFVDLKCPFTSGTRATSRHWLMRRPGTSGSPLAPRRCSVAPATCTIQYSATSRQAKRPATASPSVTAGLKCPPEIPPTA